MPGDAGLRPVAELLRQALALHQQGRPGQAEPIYREILSREPAHAEALHLLGVVHQQRGQHALAAELIARSIAADPSRAVPHSNLGIALHQLGRHEEALASFDRALALRPDYPEGLVNRGNTLRASRQPAKALADYEQALALKPQFPEAWLSRGNALQDLARQQEAIASYEQALTLRPAYPDAHLFIGNSLGELHRHAQSLASYERALEIDPAHVGALVGRGNALLRLKRNEEALACYDRVLQLRPGLHEVLNNRGSVLRELKRYAEAAEAFGRLAAALPDFAYAQSNQFHSSLYCCDWTGYEQRVARISEGVLAGARMDVPFSFLAISGSAEAQLRCARRYVADRYPAADPPLWTGQRYRHQKIRLAYLSADFHDHATAYLMAGLFELHDRERFEVTALSFGPDATGGMRDRLLPAFDAFIDVRQRSDRETAALMREMEIDIAVDLKGFTTGNRAGIFALHPAPIQVSYLGYPGTMGAAYMDYLVADARVVPADHQPFYSERIVHLPDSYQVNDAKRVISPRPPSRAEAGLPERGFVFCCFNNNYKIAPAVFSIWMRLLRQVPGSVLWLLEDNADAARNLRAEANLRGVAPERLVFAARLPLDEHLARHRLADLFLDTLPCNAHTTASDALWAGLPVLTCMGESFAGRVAGSLLYAMELPELITEDSSRYEELALRLATTPPLLAQVRSKLAQNRLASPLFDTDRFRRHLEAAYLAMWQRHERGLAPESFAIPAED